VQKDEGEISRATLGKKVELIGRGHRDEEGGYFSLPFSVII
jgi:hypothetical protein